MRTIEKNKAEHIRSLSASGVSQRDIAAAVDCAVGTVKRHTSMNRTDNRLIGDLLTCPRYLSSLPLDQGRRWSASDIDILTTLCDQKADVERSAAALGRRPKSIAWRAQEIGLVLPSNWSAIIRPKRLTVHEPRIALSYPFIIKRRDEHADMLVVNELVPRGMPGREDVCQEILLALWEGTITLDQLKANRGNVRAFVRAFMAGNYEAGGYAVSLDQPMRDGRMWHDVLSVDNLGTPQEQVSA